MRPKLASALSVVAVVAGLLFAAGAGAKSPPKGAYECTIGGIYAGTINIKSATTYKRSGSTGTYKAGKKKRFFPDGSSGHTGYSINFKSGPFQGMNGNWHKTTDGVNEIALKNPGSGFEDVYCDD